MKRKYFKKKILAWHGWDQLLPRWDKDVPGCVGPAALQRRPKVTELFCGCWQQLWGQCSCDPKPLTPFLLLLLTWGLLSSASWVISPLATRLVAEPGVLQGHSAAGLFWSVWGQNRTRNLAKQPLDGLIREKNLLGKEHSASLGLLCGGDLLGTAQDFCALLWGPAPALAVFWDN